jgi:ribosomal protein S17
MAEIAGQAENVQAEKQSHRKVLIGTVVSNKMQKTIVVEVTRKKAHPMYARSSTRTMRRTKPILAMW